MVKIVRLGPRSLRDYTTLEEDLQNCFKVRDIEIESLTVSEGASVYTIKVKRG